MEEQTESIVDALKASFEELSDEGETETPEVEATQDDPEPEVEAEAEEHSEEGTLDAEAEEDNEEEEPVTVFQTPEHWSSDDKAVFEQLPDEAKELVLARDASFQQGYQEKAQTIADIQQAIEPWKQALAQRGVTADQAIRALFAAQHQIETDPVNGILQLAKNFGVADQLQAQFTPNTDDDFTDPEVKALKQQLAELQGQLNQTAQTFNQAQTNTAQDELNKFTQAVDDKGNLTHPHFDKVRSLMAPLVNEGKSLEEAYSETVWSVPEYREKALKPKPVDEVEKAKRVKKAKKASRAINQDGTAKSTDADETLDVKSELQQAWKQLA